MSQAVISLADFKAKYGSLGWRSAIEQFIRLAPEFEGDERLAIQIGVVLADIESVLVSGEQPRNTTPTEAHSILHYCRK